MAQGKVIDRFVDADKEPTKTLTPIKGYEKSKLVSLEEAVTEIEPSIDDAVTMVWTAKRNSRNPTDGLTSDESASIHLYTLEWPDAQQSMYSLLNQKLRSEKRRELVSWHPYLKLFLTALYKLPSLKTIVWRGICGNVNDLYQDDFIWWGVSSCTETMKIMERFVGYSGERTIFMIECLNGKAIKSHSFYKDENEIILMPGTYLRVVDKWSPGHGLHMIRLQEDIPPFPLVVPPFTSSSAVNIPPLQKPTISETIQSDDYQPSPSNTLSSVGTLSSNENAVTKTNQSDYQTVPLKISPTTDNPPSDKATVSKTVQPDHAAAPTDILSSLDPHSSNKSNTSEANPLNYQVESLNASLFDPIVFSNETTVTKTNPSNRQAAFIKEASTVDISSLNEVPTSTSNQPDQKAAPCNTLLSDGTSSSNKSEISKTDQPSYQAAPYKAPVSSALLSSSRSEATGSNESDYQTTTSIKSSSTINTFSSNKSTIPKINEPDYQSTQAQLESKTSETSLLSLPPKYKNPELERQINNNKDKSYLSWSSHRLTDGDMEIVAYYLLQNNKTLKQLRLDSNKIGDQGAHYLGEALGKNTTLIILLLTNNRISDQGAQYLGEALEKNTTLTTLYLSSNKIGDQGAQYLCEALEKNTTLTRLYLSSNQIGDQGAKHLRKVFQINKTLTTLYIYTDREERSSCPIS